MAFGSRRPAGIWFRLQAARVKFLVPADRSRTGREQSLLRFQPPGPMRGGARKTADWIVTPQLKPRGGRIQNRALGNRPAQQIVLCLRGDQVREIGVTAVTLRSVGTLSALEVPCTRRKPS